MQGKGAEIDIVTGRPAEIRTRELDEEKKRAEEEMLKRQAEAAGLLGSDAGQFLIRLVADKLQKRIEEVLEKDPESAAYVKILAEMGSKDRLGREAMKKLVQAKTGQAL